jgi:hypothetical protein
MLNYVHLIYTMKKGIALIFILSFFVSKLAFSSEDPVLRKTNSLILTGKIIDKKNNEFLAGVKINCANCQKSVYSDFVGNFFIYLEFNSDDNLTLEFSQIGYESKMLNLKDLQVNLDRIDVDLIAE